MVKVNPLVFLFSIIGGIIVFVMAETWGALPKNQIDSQLITEYVDNAIANHEADPTAHLGDGESLEQHKTNEVIDHPQQSVVIDKTKFSSYDESTEPIGGYGWDPDTGSITGANTRNLYFSLSSQTEVSAIEVFPADDITPYPYADLLFRFRLHMSGAQNSNGSSYLRFAYWDGADLKGRIDFIKSGTNYYVKYYYNNVEVHSYLIQSGGSFIKNFAIYYNHTENKIELFIDGVVVDTYETTSVYDFLPYIGYAYGLRTTNTGIIIGLDRWGAKYTLW